MPAAELDLGFSAVLQAEALKQGDGALRWVMSAGVQEALATEEASVPAEALATADRTRRQRASARKKKKQNTSHNKHTLTH